MSNASKLSRGKSNKFKEEEEDSNRITNGPNVYQLGTEIGRGGFAVVYQAFNVRTGDFVAMKRFPLSTIDKESLSSIESEIELMQKLNHPNIVKYIDTIRTKLYLYIALEYMENGSLSTVIRRFGFFQESLTAIYVTQVLRGLKYLHDQGVLHRDIKGANILTTKDGMVKLADFGVAMKLNEAHADGQDVVGSPYWIAPEIIEMSAPTAACDIWSVGCIIIELLTGKPPYYDLAPMAALFRIVQDDYPPLPEGISQALRDFLFNCFQKEPAMRSSASKLLEHPWLHNSSNSTNLEQHTSKLLESKSASSQELIANSADSIVNTIRMHQREVGPSNASASVDGIAMRAPIDQARLGLGHIEHQSSVDGSPVVSKVDAGHIAMPMVSPRKPVNLPSGKGEKANIKFFASNDSNELKSSSTASGEGKKHLQSSSSASTDSATKRTGSPALEIAQAVSGSPNGKEMLKMDSKVAPSSAEGGKKLATGPFDQSTKNFFQNMTVVTESYDDDEEENWDADFVDDEDNSSSSSESDFSLNVSEAKESKSFHTSSPIRRSDTQEVPMRSTTKKLQPSRSNVSMASVSSSNTAIAETNQRIHAVGLISPASVRNLNAFREMPEEETYDDLFEDSFDDDKHHHHKHPANKSVDSDLSGFSSADTFDVDPHPHRHHHNHELLLPPKGGATHKKKPTKVSLDTLKTMSDDFDDLEFPEEGENFANKLRLKLTTTVTRDAFDDEPDGFINYQFDEKDFKQNEQKDIHFRRSKELVELMTIVRSTATEEELISCTSKIISIFDQYPDQRDHLIMTHGVMPIVDMFETRTSFHHPVASALSQSTASKSFPYYVLKITNKIIEHSTRTQEQLSLVGIIPIVMSLFEKSCGPPSPAKAVLPFKRYINSPEVSNPASNSSNSNNNNSNNQKVLLANQDEQREIDLSTMEAARFIHQISLSSSLTLQMFIGAGGLGLLTTMVSFGSRINPRILISQRTEASTPRTPHSAVTPRSPPGHRHSLSLDSEFCDNGENPIEVTIPMDSSRCMTVFQMGMDCIAQVFSVQSSRTRDFCRLFVKLGLLHHLSVSFENLMQMFKDSMAKKDHPHSATNSSSHPLHRFHSDSSMLQRNLSNSKVPISQRRTESANSVVQGNGDSLLPADLSSLESSEERLYAHAIASLFFKFSRSDSIVAATMANPDKGVIKAILQTLSAPELLNANFFDALAINTPTASTSSAANSSTSTNMLSITHPASTQTTSNASVHVLKRTKSGLNPAYLEIIELLFKCLRNLTMEPSAMYDLEQAGALTVLIKLLNGPLSERCKVYIWPCIFNMCHIEKKRQEQAVALGLIPHLKKVISEGSHLRQFAIPIIVQLAHASNITRAELWKNDCVPFYVDLLKENNWQGVSLMPLYTWLNSDPENVSRILIQPNCLSKLIEFFRNASNSTIHSLHKPWLDIMNKSKDLSCSLSGSGVFVSTLVRRLKVTTEAIVLRSLLKMLQLLHQYHPCPRQFVLDNHLYKLVKEFAESKSQVLVCEIANKLLADFQVSTLT